MLAIGGIISIIIGIWLISSSQSKSKNDIEIEENITPQEYRGGKGSLQINLQWYSEDDLDLSVFDPCDNLINFKNKKAKCGQNNSIGYLDLDENVKSLRKDPQENIYWETNPPEGNYRVFVNFYRRHSEKSKVTFILSIIAQNNNPIEIKKVITENQELEIVQFEYRDFKIKSYQEL